eukprot:114393_1
MMAEPTQPNEVVEENELKSECNSSKNIVNVQDEQLKQSKIHIDKHINKWSCQDLQEWIHYLDISTIDKQIVLNNIIDTQCTGSDLMSCESSQDILDSFDKITKNVADIIYNEIQYYHKCYKAKMNKKHNKSNKIPINIENKPIIKILFLDIDGVMNTLLLEQDIDTDPNALFKIDRIDRLKHILKQTNCKIVLSTAWRRHDEMKSQIKQEFIKNKIDWNDIYIGDTPIEDDFKCDLNMTQRTYEINKYLKSIESKYCVKMWCAVDDMTLDYFYDDKNIMKGHFVHTDGYVGITDKDTLQIINILNK